MTALRCSTRITEWPASELLPSASIHSLWGGVRGCRPLICQLASFRPRTHIDDRSPVALQYTRSTTTSNSLRAACPSATPVSVLLSCDNTIIKMDRASKALAAAPLNDDRPWTARAGASGVPLTTLYNRAHGWPSIEA